MSVLQAKIDYNAKKDKGHFMKKTFPLHSDTKQTERVIEALKHEIRKYLKRERNKKLPEGSPFWIFECRIGENEERAKEVFVHELIAAIDTAYTLKWHECYIEILAKPAKNLKPKEEEK